MISVIRKLRFVALALSFTLLLPMLTATASSSCSSILKAPEGAAPRKNLTQMSYQQVVDLINRELKPLEQKHPDYFDAGADSGLKMSWPRIDLEADQLATQDFVAAIERIDLALSGSELDSRGQVEHQALKRQADLQKLKLKNFKYDYLVDHIKGWPYQVIEIHKGLNDLKTESDVEDYFATLKDLGPFLEHLADVVKNRAQNDKIVLPLPAIDPALETLKRLTLGRPFTRAPDDFNELYAQFNTKISAFSEDRQKFLRQRFLNTVRKHVVPGSDKLAQTLNDLKPLAQRLGHFGLGTLDKVRGVQAFREQYQALQTTEITPIQAATRAKSEMSRVHSDLATISVRFADYWKQKGFAPTNQVPQTEADLKALGVAKQIEMGKELLAWVTSQDQFRYPPGAGDEMLRDAQKTVIALRGFERIFGVNEAVTIDIETVPLADAKFSSSALYEDPVQKQDGTWTNGVYRLNVRGSLMQRWRQFELAAHEAKGHGVQRYLQLTKLLMPDYRRSNDRFASEGFDEGWSVWSEKLGTQFGPYREHPLAQFGLLWVELTRLQGVILDVGIHHGLKGQKPWTFEQAAKEAHVMSPIGGDEAQSIDIWKSILPRFAVWPGQISSYMVGYWAVRDMYDHAQTQLSSQYNGLKTRRDRERFTRAFNKEVLSYGNLPFTELRLAVDDWIKRKRSP